MVHLARRIGFAEVSSIGICILGFVVPLVTTSPLALSLNNQILIAIIASYSVFVMLRMNLITFAVPAFMALGGYCTALAARNGLTEFLVLLPLSFFVSAVVAVPLGALVLRLRGIFFVLVTFLLTEILQLLLFEIPSVTGGANGITSLPAVTVFGARLDDNRSVALMLAMIAFAATLIVVGVTRFFRQHFAGIDENEILAESLGLVVWRYKSIGFAISAGLAGMAGFGLVNMLLTAHPSSFATLNSVNYLTYTIVGGASSILGPIVGSGLLVWAGNVFSSQGEYSQGFFGLLIILVTLFAPGGIAGTAGTLLRRVVNKAGGQGQALGGATEPVAVVKALSSGVAWRRSDAASPELEICALSKSFGGLRVFDGISFKLPPGSILGVIGPNGAGKTTLINVVSGRLRSTAGAVLLAKRDITGEPMAALSGLGVVRSFQHTNIFRAASVRENIARAICFSGAKLDASNLKELLETFDLANRLDDRGDKLPYGLQKMLGLVLVYVTQPRVLLLDEPAAGLERRERTRIDEFLRRVQQELGCSVLIVEHDMDLVRRLCPRILVLDAGQVLADGAPGDVLTNPQVIRAYLGATEEEN